MKNKALISFFVAPMFLFVSCKKESSIGIVGDWKSVSVYTMQNNGIYSWIGTGGHSDFYAFSDQGTFASSTDVPGGSGKYSYDSGLQSLVLNYDADRYGNVPGTEILKVELLTNDKLIVSYLSSGNVRKTEYARVN